MATHRQETKNKVDTDGARATAERKTAASSRAADTRARTLKSPAPPRKIGQSKPETKARKPANDKNSPEKNQQTAEQTPKVMEFYVDLGGLVRNTVLLLLLAFVFIPFLLSLIGSSVTEVSLSDFAADLKAGKIESIQTAGDELRLEYKPEYIDNTIPTHYIVRKESNETMLDILAAADIKLTETNLQIKDMSMSHLLLEAVITFMPLILTVALFYFLLRRRGGADIFGIGKSKAKVFTKSKQTVKFADVGGMDEAKKELEEIVDFLKNPKKYQKVGARTPKGVLLVGPAGTGKTLLARAVAGEAGVQFLSIAGSEFMEMLVGVGASRVRDLFETAKKNSPSIIFIDEIDAIGRIRVGGGYGGHDEREQTLNQILVEMDGFSQNDNVIVIAATNRGDMLDPALVRPGRFDRRVVVSLPDIEERRFIINIHKKGKPFASDLDWEQVAKMTTGFSGADIENMLNEAAISIVRERCGEITLQDLSEASVKVKMGPSKKRLTDEYERKMTAYHEVGHALLSHVLPYADGVSRISIISRGHALGYTITPPNRDKMQTTKSELLDEICVMLGGRGAEEIVFNELTAGASSDIARATKIARRMVEEWGMSSLGPVYLAPQYEDSEYVRAFEEPRQISPQLAAKVDAEVAKIMDEAHKRTVKILSQYRAKLDQIAAELLEKETLEGKEFEALMGEHKAGSHE